MGRIFISYRRDDTEYISGYIYEHLARIFGKDRIFFDVDTIAGGVDYRKAINDAIADTAIMLVVIGPTWLTAEATPAVRRLTQPNDPVRLEIEAAIQRNVPIFPLLVQQASVPAENELPSSMAQLSYQNAFAVRPGSDFPRDMERVSATIERYVPRRTAASSAPGTVPPAPMYPTPMMPAPAPVYTSTPAWPPYPASLAPRGASQPATAQGNRFTPLVGIVIALIIVTAAVGAFYLTSHSQSAAPPTLTVQPATYNLTCPFDANGTYSDPAPSNVVTLDNSANSMSIDWSTSVTDNDPAGHVWASTSPTQGTIAAGQQATVTVIPGATFCHDLQTSQLGTFTVKVIYHVTGQTTSATATIRVLAG
jgi:hypothetical protein